MGKDLNQVEQDFIKFMSKKQGEDESKVKEIFLGTKSRFDFASERYRKLNDDMHNLFRILYNEEDEEVLIDSYKKYELMHLFRMIAYSYGFRDRMSARLVRNMARIARPTGKAPLPTGEAAIADHLITALGKDPVVVDYGCGLGYISFEIAKRNKAAKVYLVDIDTMILEFAKFRFARHGFDAEIIPVTKTMTYPKLPKHNICVIMSVMEHLKDPLSAYRNIYNGMEAGGILCGNFADTRQEMFHVSADLSALRTKVAGDYREISACCYKKL